MKKIGTVILLLMAIHFAALAAGAAWMWQSGHLDRARVAAIREMLFPKPQPATQPTTAPAADPATQPLLKLEELLARQSGRPATEQVEFIQRAFDTQMSLLDRRQRELTDLQRQVELAKQQLSRDRAALEAQQKSLLMEKQQAERLRDDKGFQDSLSLYAVLPGKQVKTIFMSLDDATVVRYLQAMQPRTASKILKEFKTPEEVQHVQVLMEKVRLAEAQAREK